MTAIDFPNSPSNGTSFSASGKTWTYNGSVWVLNPRTASKSAYDIAVENGFVGTEAEWVSSLQGADGASGKYAVSETAPTSPTAGDGWFDSATGKFFIYYDSYWVEFGTATGPQGVAGNNGADGGFNTAQVIETKSANYTLTSADAGKLMLNSADVTITVQGLAVGTQVDFLQMVTNRITFAAGVGITLVSKGGNLKTAGQYSPATVKCLTSTSYALVGDLGA